MDGSLSLKAPLQVQEMGIRPAEADTRKIPAEKCQNNVRESSQSSVELDRLEARIPARRLAQSEV